MVALYPVDHETSRTWHAGKSLGFSFEFDCFKIKQKEKPPLSRGLFLLLDVDYVVASDRLSTMFEDPREFICHQSALDLTHPVYVPTETFGEHCMHMSWATVIKFTRSKVAEFIFDKLKKNFIDMTGSPQQKMNTDDI